MLEIIQPLTLSFQIGPVLVAHVRKIPNYVYSWSACCFVECNLGIMEKKMETTIMGHISKMLGLYERRLLFIVWLINRIYNPWSLISFALDLIRFLTGNLRAQNAVISFAIMVMLLSNMM